MSMTVRLSQREIERLWRAPVRQNDTKEPSGKETFPEVLLRAASEGPQGGHQTGYAYVPPFRLKQERYRIEMIL